MTPSDMNQLPEPAPQDDLDTSTVEAVLSGARPSGDPALDDTIAGLRSLVEAAPEPSGELAELLGSAVVPPLGDEVGRRRAGGARHLATGTTVVVGVVFATATAAAAIGGLGGSQHHAAPTPHPVVVPSTAPATPKPVRTTPADLPRLPVALPAATDEQSEPSTTGSHGKVDPSPVSSSRRPTASDDSSEADGPDDDTQQTRTEDDDERSTPSSTQTGDHDEDSDSSTTGPGDEHGDDQGDGDSSGTGSGDGDGGS